MAWDSPLWWKRMMTPKWTVRLPPGARILGVNNRNLKTFTVDTENSRRLRSRIPQNVLFVSESGVKTAEDVAGLQPSGQMQCSLAKRSCVRRIRPQSCGN